MNTTSVLQQLGGVWCDDTQWAAKDQQLRDVNDTSNDVK